TLTVCVETMSPLKPGSAGFPNAGFFAAALCPTTHPLDLALNATSYAPGQHMILSATLVPDGVSGLVDVYVMVRLPDSSLLSLQPGGGDRARRGAVHDRSRPVPVLRATVRVPGAARAPRPDVPVDRAAESRGNRQRDRDAAPGAVHVLPVTVRRAGDRQRPGAVRRVGGVARLAIA